MGNPRRRRRSSSSEEPNLGQKEAEQEKAHFEGRKKTTTSTTSLSRWKKTPETIRRRILKANKLEATFIALSPAVA